MRCISHRALLDGGRRTWNANDEVPASVVIRYRTHKRTQHFLRNVEIENSAAANWPVHFHAPRLAPEKFQGLTADRQNLAIVTVNRHDGRLVQHNTFVRIVD